MIISIGEASWNLNIPFLKLISIFRFGFWGGLVELGAWDELDIVCAFLVAPLFPQTRTKGPITFL